MQNGRSIPVFAKVGDPGRRVCQSLPWTTLASTCCRFLLVSASQIVYGALQPRSTSSSGQREVLPIPSRVQVPNIEGMYPKPYSINSNYGNPKYPTVRYVGSLRILSTLTVDQAAALFFVCSKLFQYWAWMQRACCLYPFGWTECMSTGAKRPHKHKDLTLFLVFMWAFGPLKYDMS